MPADLSIQLLAMCFFRYFLGYSVELDYLKSISCVLRDAGNVSETGFAIDRFLTEGILWQSWCRYGRVE